jgi:carbamoyl-phosphate synthase/aspartate carbamoyltransferase/dihydroorotase
MVDTIKLPGLIDPHVHLRDPGQTDKEDFYTGTVAALAGGFTTVIDMPNNLEPITTLERLERKIASAKKQTVCDIGFYFGTLGDNFVEFPKVVDKVKGLKVYLNITTGGFTVDPTKLSAIYRAWESTKPILLHAEEDVLDEVFKTVSEQPKTTHVCHVSSKKELEFVIRAKEAGLPVSCGVTPHHLFLTDEDAKSLKGYGYMKPFLKSKVDQDFLWQHLKYIDVIESDHAPHTKAEKEADPPLFGVPGLETTLPLLLTAEAEGRLTRTQLIERLHTNPARIFGVPVNEDTYIEINMNEYVIVNDELLTKSGWSPFAGWHVIGRVHRVVLRDQEVYRNAQVLVQAGNGQILS